VHEIGAREMEDVDVTPPPREQRTRTTRPAEPRRGDSRTSRGGSKPAKRGGRGDPRDDGDFVRIYVPLGRRSGVRPSDLVGAIANEARVSSQHIGAIDIADSFSLVEVKARDADAIVAALRRTTIRGKMVKVRRERF
jgi:ATP-dependent RNA helicase DeaD